MGDSNRLEAIIATSGRLLALPNFAGLGNGSPKPMSEEEADRLTLAQKVARMEQIGDTCTQIDTYKRDFILAHAGEIRSFLKMFDNQGRSGPALRPDGQPIVIKGESVHTKKRAVRLLFNASLGYLYEIIYPKPLRPKAEEKAKKEGAGEGEVVDAEVVKVPATVEDWLAFFARLTQEQRQAAYEAIRTLMEPKAKARQRKTTGERLEEKIAHEKAREEELQALHPSYAEAKKAYYDAHDARYSALLAQMPEGDGLHVPEEEAILSQMSALDDECQPLYDKMIAERRKAEAKLRKRQRDATGAKRSEAARKAAATRKARKEDQRLVNEALDFAAKVTTPLEEE